MYFNFENVDKIPIKKSDKIPIIKVNLQKNNFSPKKKDENSLESQKSVEFTPIYLNQENLKTQKNTNPELKKAETLEKITEKSIDSFEITEQNLNLLKKIKYNFKEMDKSQKTLFFVLFTISSLIYILCSIYIFQNYFYPNIKKSKITQFFCLGLDLLENPQFCIIAVGQKSFGFLAIGQISIGFFAIGQISLGFFSIGQVSFAFFLCYLGQVSVSAVCWYSMCSISWLFSRFSMIGTSAFRPLFFRDKKPYVLCCD